MHGPVVLIHLLASLLSWDMVVINKYLLTDQFPDKSKDTEEHPLYEQQRMDMHFTFLET